MQVFVFPKARDPVKSRAISEGRICLALCSWRGALTFALFRVLVACAGFGITVDAEVWAIGAKITGGNG